MALVLQYTSIPIVFYGIYTLRRVRMVIAQLTKLKLN